MRTAIAFAFGNFTLTFFALGLIASAISLLRAPKPLTSPAVVEALLRWFIFFSIGCSYFCNFVFHVAFGDLAARFIGWANSPFQLEVGFASLGFSLIGFFAVRRGFDVRVAAILGPTAFLWGAAAGHIYQMVTAHNFAPGNAGVIFWSDVLLPIIGFALLRAQHRAGRPARI